MANYGYYDEYAQDEARYGGGTKSFDYGHGHDRHNGRGEVWDEHDHRRSPPLPRGFDGGRNGRPYDHFDRSDPPRRGGLLKTPPPSSRSDHPSQQYHDFEPEFDRGRRHHSPPPPPRPHHSRSRSPLLKHDFPSPSYDPYTTNYHDREERPERRHSHERTQVYDYDYRSARPPGSQDDTRNRHHSRDKDRYGALDKPNYQQPLLPEPEFDHRSGNQIQRSFSAERNRDECDQRRFHNEPLLPEPELEHQERESLRNQWQQRPNTRHSFSPDRDKFVHDTIRQDLREPSRDLRPALLPEPAVPPELAEAQHNREAPKKSVHNVQVNFVTPVKYDQTQVQLEQAFLENQQLVQNLEQSRKKVT